LGEDITFGKGIFENRNWRNGENMNEDERRNEGTGE
jgi:hypothetical protein